jgi:hypothetical protein
MLQLSLTIGCCRTVKSSSQKSASTFISRSAGLCELAPGFWAIEQVDKRSVFDIVDAVEGTIDGQETSPACHDHPDEFS